ncbi:MAG: twin-arginine translocase TatA/TatE family subunit [Desulfobacterales bacterium]
MFGIGMPELFLILAIALIVIGPKKLPDVARSLGRAMNEFRKATREIKDSLDINDDLKEVRESFKDLNSDIRGSLDDRTAPSDASGKADDETEASKTPPNAPAAEKTPNPIDAPGKGPDERG